MALALVLLAGCGWSDGTESNEEALAARGRAALVATFTETSYRLPPVASPACVEQRQSSSQDGNDDPYENDVYCSLTSTVMGHLVQRLDQGLGTGVTAQQRSCINQRVTRDQIAALLSAELGSGRDREARVAEFDAQLASSIRHCTNS